MLTPLQWQLAYAVNQQADGRDLRALNREICRACTDCASHLRTAAFWRSAKVALDVVSENVSSQVERRGHSIKCTRGRLSPRPVVGQLWMRRVCVLIRACWLGVQAEKAW